MNRICTKLITALLCVAILTSTISACGFGHSESLMETSCSGYTCRVNTVECTLQGQNFMGTFHPDTCQILQYYKYTENHCTYSGCTYSANAGTHYCEYKHEQAGVSGTVCPY